MACACGGSSARSSARRQQATSTSGGGAYVVEVTYNDGTTATFATEQEAQAALAFKGGGYRTVPR